MQASEKCARCSEVRDETLMLSCVHDLCLSCAALQFNEESLGKRNHHQLTCRFCGKKTSLDLSSVYELQKLAYSLKREIKRTGLSLPDHPSSKKPEERQLPPQQQQRQEYRTQDLQPRDMFRDPKLKEFWAKREEPLQHRLKDHKDRDSEKQRDLRDIDRTLARDEKSAAYLLKQKRLCSEHEDEEVTYFCFLCLCGICAECAIHGSHQGHEVKAIKRAAPVLKERVQQFSDSLESTVVSLNSLREESLASIRVTRQRGDKQVARLRVVFAELKELLASKERQVEKNVSAYYGAEAKRLEENVAGIEREMAGLEQFRKMVRALGTSGDFELIASFGRVSKLHAEQRETELGFREKYAAKEVEGLRVGELEAELRHLGEALLQLDLS